MFLNLVNDRICLVHATSVWTQASSMTRCAHGNHPRVQEPLVLSITVEVHRLLKPALISQSFDLPFAPFPTGIAYENAMQPASMSHANPFYLPFYKCKSQGLFKCAVIQRRLSEAASFSACSADLIHWLKWRSVCSYYIFSPALWCGRSCFDPVPATSTSVLLHLIVHPHNFCKMLSGESLPSALMPLGGPNTICLITL